MLRLATFGGVSLTREGAPVVGSATVPRRLALFALLAAHGDRGMNRELLAGLLWPESAPEQARHSLHQAIYATRRALGDDVIVGTASLHLHPAHIETDVAAFEDAVHTGQLERAAKLYRGPFAEALVVSMAAELEQKLDTLRAEFARKYTTALESLATSAARLGDQPAAARWWRRLADHDSLNGRYARELIAALAAAGETAQALQFALVHDALVRQETSAAPAPEVIQWIQRLRTSSSAGTGGVTKATPVFTVSTEARPTIDRRRSRLARVTSARYSLSSLLEEGAVTATYLAHACDRNPPHELEINVLQPRVAALVSADRFIESMRRVSLLAEPHVLPTLDAAVAEEMLYFVTSRRPAATLRDRLKRERALSIIDAVGIAHGVAAALAHAHDRGVVHGDLRPKHIGLAGTEAVVRGFGLVEALSEVDGDSSSSTVVAIGSPAYLSPEQRLDNAPPSARGDLYALGCICYEMLTGERPLAPGRSKATPVRELRETVSEPLARFVHACMARLPADRPASSGDAMRQLAALQSVTI